MALSGTVTVNGVPMNGWCVCANEVNDASQSNRTNTDTNGNYQMTLFPGTYRIGVEGSYVDHWGGTSTSFSLPVGYPGAQNLVMNGDAVLNVAIPVDTLTGRVVDTNGQGIPNATASMTPINWNPLDMPFWSSSTVSAADGSYKLFILPGTSSIEVTPPSGTRSGGETIQVDISGDSAQDITLGEQLSTIRRSHNQRGTGDWMDRRCK